MKQISNAAIYARISSDQGGEGLGVQRQLEDCRRLASDRGWAVIEEYVDNDISAFSGKLRPSYERMLADVTHGRIDAILVYHLDRLTRRPIELEHFIEVCTSAGVDVTTVTGDVGLGNDNGLMIARITSAMAAAESGRKSARIKRKVLQNVQQGKPNGGGNRPFGYELDRLTIREPEAEIIRHLVDRYIDGESLNSLARWLNERRISTTGKADGWHVQTLRPILIGGRIAGIRDHLGKAAAPALWPAIITSEQHRRVLAVFASKQYPRFKQPRRYLLSGLLRCGRCGGKLYSANPRGVRRYACSTAPGRRGCGQLSINAAKVEDLVASTILSRLDSEELIALLMNRAGLDHHHSEEIAEVGRADRAVLEVARMFGSGEISRAEFMAARKAATLRRSKALGQLDRVTGTGILGGLGDDGAEYAQSWNRLTLDRQRAIVCGVLAEATIQPRPAGARKLDPTRVEYSWAI